MGNIQVDELYGPKPWKYSDQNVPIPVGWSRPNDTLKMYELGWELSEEEQVGLINRLKEFYGKYTPMPSPAIIKESFPEGKEILKSLVRESGAVLKNIEEWLKKVYLDESNSEDVKGFITSYVNAFYYDRLLKNHSRMKRELSMYEGKKSDLDVPSAKAVPIETLFSPEKPRQTSQRITCRCPLHDEKLSSFVIYKKNNSFHCFGCKAGGDSIAFVQKLYKVSFVAAVKIILGG